MEALFAERLKLSPLAETAIALLNADPSLGLVLTARPGPLRDRFVETLCACPRWHGARHLARRDLGPAAFGADRLGSLVPMPENAGTETPAPRSLAPARPMGRTAGGHRAAPLILAGVDRCTVADAAGLLGQIGDGHPILALDESLGDDALPSNLADRLGLWLDLSAPDAGAIEDADGFGDDLACLAPAVPSGPVDPLSVHVPEPMIDTICEAAAAFGIASLRAPLLALCAARASAVCAGRERVEDEDVLLACRLVLAPRATRAPVAGEPETGESEEPGRDETEDASPQTSPDETQSAQEKRQSAANDSRSDPEESPEGGETSDADHRSEIATEDVAIPIDLLQKLAAMVRGNQKQAGGHGRRGAGAKTKPGASRGRPLGSRPGHPRNGPLDLSATLTAALPWQRFRKRLFERLSDRAVILMPDDLRIRRLEARRETATIFLVDASGSAALARLTQAKGAVERILAECYKRRDRVAMASFRGTGAETLLPETRSLTRARKALAGLAAGGGTPLAAGLERAGDLARASEGQGRTPLIVVLTDGKANVALDGVAGRSAAWEDARRKAEGLRSDGFASLVIDLASRPGQHARDLTQSLGGRYLALPAHDDGAVLADAVAADPTKKARP
ncbi:VWA domain-containing protein [Fulvimarina endophytica]|uniref:VWA domain-containing protein n=1 Tax=Fulvimarina endophytica TaxID=2293836 RepID=A0A371X6W3_9HYPH|nr:VWA domain-containing protein [Fulvimarina endophytica]RFC64968.1 VWA domain-containing protein [Fulvimarina endophytica]